MANELLREENPDLAKTTVEFGGLVLDPIHKTATYHGREIKLNPLKFEIMHFLISNKTNVISRESLIRYLKKEKEIFDRTIDVHISQIRKLLQKEEILNFCIISIYGSGYRLEFC